MTEIELIGAQILQAVELLKGAPSPLNARCPVELYLTDKDYDIQLWVMLKKKKSQYQLGLEMFNGEHWVPQEIMEEKKR